MDSDLANLPARCSFDDDVLSFDGEPVRRDPQQELPDALAAVLYARIYARLPTDFDNIDPAADHESVAKIAAAVATVERWDAGWQVDSVGPGGVISVVKDASWRYVQPGDFRRDPAGRPLGPRSRVAILIRPLDLESQPGSVFIHGDALDDRALSARIGRWYLNVDLPQALAVIERLTRRMNQFRLPFTIKCPARRELFERVDSMVLYVPTRFHQLTARLLSETCADIEMHDRVPLFTARLAAGVGFAEDPGDGSSFGSRRCNLLADALLSRADVGSVEGWLKDLSAAFERAGLDLTNPHLRPGSIDRYPDLHRAGGQ